MNRICEIQAATRIVHILPNSHHVIDLVLRVVLKARFHCNMKSVCEIQVATEILNIMSHSQQILNLIFRVVMK